MRTIFNPPGREICLSGRLDGLNMSMIICAFDKKLILLIKKKNTNYPYIQLSLPSDVITIAQVHLSYVYKAAKLRTFTLVSVLDTLHNQSITLYFSMRRRFTWVCLKVVKIELHMEQKYLSNV